VQLESVCCRYDLVDVTREAMQLLFMLFYNETVENYQRHHYSLFKSVLVVEVVVVVVVVIAFITAKLCTIFKNTRSQAFGCVVYFIVLLNFYLQTLFLFVYENVLSCAYTSAVDVSVPQG